MARVPADATAFAHRDRGIMGNIVSFYESDDERPEHEACASVLARELSRGDDAVYAGFLGDESETRVRAAYPGPTWDRLEKVKADSDPDNLFRLNQNIPPTAR